LNCAGWRFDEHDQAGQVSAMTRQERAEQLNELVKTEKGLSEIVRTYHHECDPPDPGDRDPPHAIMIDSILNAEFPPQSPGFLAKS
jgi:hypothetical protein